MKFFNKNGVEILKSLKSPTIIKIISLFTLSIAFFYFGKNFSSNTNFLQKSSFFNPSITSHNYSISISPNFNKKINLSYLISPNSTQNQNNEKNDPKKIKINENLTRFGIVDENGTMSDNFEVNNIEKDNKFDNLTDLEEKDDKIDDEHKVFGEMKIERCDKSLREYIPCLDNKMAIKKLKSTEKGERFERHCPEKGKELSCLVPAPKGYKSPIPWPKSRDQVWFSNVPHARLAEDKGGQNWVFVDKDKFKFPGGGTQFIHGADKYLDQISEMVSDISFGRNTRIALDVGCGVASFGAYLLSRNVLTMSVAPKDVHENQIQFALERGVPAMAAAFATRRLLYPSEAFDLVHCSRCRVNWTRDDGILLLEVNRMIRAGGYFVWAAQPVYKHERLLELQWEEMTNLTSRMCWNLVKKQGYIAIWQKPLNNSCYFSRKAGTQPPLCDSNDDPDNVWYTDLKACISRLPEDGAGANVTPWPARLHEPPARLQSIQMDAYISRKELFTAESKYWSEIIESYVRVLHWKKFNLRNVLDMRAGFGGFATALIEQKFDCWVLNVVPVSGPNTLPVIYDRGLLGVMHDWCESFDTYPRTYDLLHAAGLFSIEQKRCNISSIMLEMDRILRPGGRVYIRDTLSVLDELQDIGKAMGWSVYLRDTSEGPHASYRILTCEKRFLRT